MADGRPKKKSRRKTVITAVVVMLFHVMGFASSIHAVMSTRTSQGAIAWAVTLNTFPYLAVPAYWVFGRSKFQGYVVSRRNTDDLTERIEREVLETVAPYRVTEADRVEAASAAEGLAGMPVLSGNRADLLIDGDATFKSILKGIDEAKEYVLVQFYIVHDDGLGRALKDHLIAKAKQDVRVYFLFDEIGSHALPNTAIASNSTSETIARSWSPTGASLGSGGTTLAMNISAKTLSLVTGEIPTFGSRGRLS
jgi:cardiolipin synthase